jgi:hypothetical protein
MGEARPVGARHDTLQVTLDPDRILVPCQPESLRKPPYVRVDDDALCVSELGCDDVRGLPGDAGQPDELGERPRYLAVELLEEHTHRAADRLGLLPEEPRRVDVAFELLSRYREVVLGLPVLLEERRRDAVHVHVSRLRGEHHGDEELEVGAEAQRDLGIGVLRRQALDDRADPLAPPAEAAQTRLADVATRHEATRSTPSSRRSSEDR